jgi:hypothetical protein
MTQPNVSRVPRTAYIPPADCAASRTRPVDPAALAAEWEIRLVQAGHLPGDGYDRARTEAAARAFLAAFDIPAVAA